MSKKTIVEFKYRDKEREKLHVYHCYPEDQVKMEYQYIEEALLDFDSKTNEKLEIIKESIRVKHKY